MSLPELGGGGGQMQDFGLSFEMCVHGSPSLGEGIRVRAMDVRIYAEQY